jgi:hypothetical protein
LRPDADEATLGCMWICVACGNHYPAASSPPAGCIICADERQFVPPDGQRWTTLDDLKAAGHRTDIRHIEAGLWGIGVTPKVGIGQRALLVCTEAGNLLWDPPGYLDEAAVEHVASLGGLVAVTASHPHFYGAMAQWAATFGAPVLVPEVDRPWVTDRTGRLQTWTGTHEVMPGVTLVQCGGHFPGSAVVHWAQGHNGAGVLLTGDSIFVTPGGDRATFVYSAPNRLPLPAHAVHAIATALGPFAFERLYDGWWTPVLQSGAKHTVEAAVQRYTAIVEGDIPG